MTARKGYPTPALLACMPLERTTVGALVQAFTVWIPDPKLVTQLRTGRVKW
jgi:hypothetical protein